MSASPSLFKISTKSCHLFHPEDAQKQVASFRRHAVYLQRHRRQSEFPSMLSLWVLFWVTWSHGPEKAMAPHCSPLAWNISGRRSLVGCSPWVAKSQAQLSDFPFTFHFHALEKAMATHSSVLAWKISGTGEPAGLPSWGRTESDTTELTWQQQQAHGHR